MIFKTTRLSIRLLNIDDADAFIDLQSNEKVMRFTTGIAMTNEECMADLNRVIDYYQTKPDFKVWAVCLSSDQTMIGTCALIHEGDKTEIGYRLREKYWGQKFGSEIAKGLIDYCFKELELRKIYAEVDVLNVASEKILAKLMNFDRQYYIAEEDCTAKLFSLINLF